MEKRKKKKKEVSKKMIPSNEEIEKMLDMSEFAQVMYVDWGNPFGTKSIRSKSRRKLKKIKNIERGGEK